MRWYRMLDINWSMFHQQQWILYNERDRKNFVHFHQQRTFRQCWMFGAQENFFHRSTMPLNCSLSTLSLPCFVRSFHLFWTFLFLKKCLTFLSADRLLLMSGVRKPQKKIPRVKFTRQEKVGQIIWMLLKYFVNFLWVLSHFIRTFMLP